jgi:CheY-like chemotaxis protein
LVAPTLGPQIKVVTQLNPSVPSVFADAEGLESAVLNLIVNARDAMIAGGTLTITSETRVLEQGPLMGTNCEMNAGAYAKVSISDTGQGMTPEIAERAFEPFFTTKAKEKGTGLGLAMVHGFFTQSGGTVRIYSELGYGTTVSFYLPILWKPSQATHEPATEEISYRGSGTILVVDDEADLLEVAAAALKEVGYNLLTAEDGASALLLIEQHQDIDVLLTDIVMPGGMNGIELAEQIVTKRPQIKVIFCSGFPPDAFSEKRIPLAERPLLRKPYQRSELLSIVRKTFLETNTGSQREPPLALASHGEQKVHKEDHNDAEI